MKPIELFIWVISFGIFLGFREIFGCEMFLFGITLIVAVIVCVLYACFYKQRKLLLGKWDPGIKIFFLKEGVYYIPAFISLVLLIIGCFLFRNNVKFLVQYISKRLLNDPSANFQHSLSLGIFIAVFLGSFINLLINWRLWKYMSKQQLNFKEKKSFVVLLGMLEIILYMVALNIKQPQFIGFWIGTKVAVTWQSFSVSAKDGTSSHHIFLIGNALNILWACLGAWIAFGPDVLRIKN